MYSSMKTITLNLYNIGTEKKSIIDEAMVNYSRAFQFLLDTAYNAIDDILIDYKNNNGRYKALNINKWIDRQANEKLNEFCIEPFKDSLKVDFEGVLLEYLNGLTNGRETSYPVAFISDEKFNFEYNILMNDCSDNVENYKETEQKIKKLIELKDKIRPLFFCRYSEIRNYSLVYDSEKNRYYAKIYLMNVKNEKRKKALINPEKSLRYICRDNKVFEKSSRKNCFLVFPLSFGSYQEEYLKKALKNPEILRTARLIKKNNKYFLSISIIEDINKEVIPISYMGISRGIDCAVSYAVVDFDGNQISEGFIEAKEDFVKDCEINKIANCLIRISEKNKSLIIMENLKNSRDGLEYIDNNGKNHRPVLSISNYNKLYNVLNAKAKGVGLPKIIKVSGRDIFYSCNKCGSTSKQNRFSDNILICTKCGMYNTVEKSGSLNLAKKLIKYNNDKITIFAQDTQRGLRLINNELGFEFYPQNPYDCIDEFDLEIDKLIKSFYENINIESQDKSFMKRLSMIKKIEKNKKCFRMIRIN